MLFPPRTRMLAVVTVMSVLCGCSDIYYDRRESISLGAGDAIAADKVTHMVDPWPANVGNRNMAFNGQRMQAAQERYRQNRVIPPVSISTSSVGYQRLAPDFLAPASPGISAPPAAPVR